MTTQASPPHARRRPWFAALLSVFLPGLGQVYGGAERRGVVLFAIDAALLAFLYYVYQAMRPFLAVLGGNRDAEISGFAQELVNGWFRPGGLALYMVINVAILVYRGWAAYDAAEVTRGPMLVRPSKVGVAIAGGLAAVVMLPHAVFAYYDVAQFNFLTTVFSDEDVAAAPPTTVAGDGDDPAAGATATTANPAPEPALWDGLERLNILLMGGDAGPERRAIRTDTMIVASIDPSTGDAAMFSVPRNWARVPLPEGHGVWDCQCFPRILNDLYYAGEIEYPNAFPGPGTPGENAIKMGMGEFLGIPIHYYALVDLNGFVGIVDALGGVEIDVPFRIVDETYPHEDGVTVEFVDIAPGRQTLDGHLALAYARIRRHADDYARMSRQRCVLEAVLEQSDASELLVAYPRILNVLKDTLRTDIPISRLDDFIELLPVIDTDSIVALRLIPPDYRNGYNDFGFSTPDVELIQEHVSIVMNNPPDVAIAQLGIETLEDACA